MTQLKTSAKFSATSKDKPSNLLQKVIMQIKELKTNTKATVSTETPKSPLDELTYVSPQSINPIAIFSNQFSPKVSNQFFLADDGTDIKDKCLIGIWVTPQYRDHLLYWISKWDDVKRQEVFGDRKPEDILISSAKDLAPLEK